MENIIAAVITAVVTLIGAGLYYNYKIKTIYKNSEKLVEEHGKRSAEHNNLSMEHRDISHRIAMVDSNVKRAESGVQSIVKDLTDERARQALRYEHLTVEQKDMIGSIENIKAMAEELKRLVSENVELKQELRKEKEKNMDLREQINKKQRDRGMQR